MGLMEDSFALTRFSLFNPLVWLIRGYHYLFGMAWFANSREQEYAADRKEVAQVGKEQAAATSILLEVVHRLPWSRVSSIAEACVSANEPMDRIFAEQIRRARATGPSEWEDALRAAMKEKTKLFDTHPCLKDRLKAIGISPKKAKQIPVTLDGQPASALLPAWPRIEKKMTDQIIAIYREYWQQKMDFMQIVAGRPLA
jgi:Zn-dependent protease with chaperone function